MFRRAFRRPNIRLQPREYKRQYNLFTVSKEVRAAISARRPVVALESTIYTHGFPYPANAELALSLESVVRLNGGVPATIGILNGVARVGLRQDELLELASAAGNPKTMKVSRRDLGLITGMGIAGDRMTGGTTISGTMILAAKAGIHVFGTGGLGGVHRGGEDTLDISADLTELGRTPVCVVSSGCKSFLDIPRTLEYLETQGALVATFADGRSGEIDFPAFWTRDSGVKSPAVIQNEVEAASIIHAQRRLELKSGMLFANPIPVEHSIPKAEMDIAINAAIQEANEKGFFGHRNTPFILAKIKELTEGKSVPANRALVESNVAVATKVAVELSNMIRQSENRGAESWNGHDISKSRSNEVVPAEAPSSVAKSKPSSNKVPSLETLTPDIIVVGSIAMDLACNYAPFNSSDLSPQFHTSNPAEFESTIGGVGNNIANAISKVIGSDGPRVQLRSFVGNDFTGRAILDNLKHHNQSTSGIKVLDGGRTAQYVSINDTKKNLVMAMADMSILDVDEAIWEQYSEEMYNSPPPKYLVVDGNWPANIIASCIRNGKKQGSTVIFEPVSVAKSARLFSQDNEGSRRKIGLGIYPNNSIDISSPNEHELAAMYSTAKAADLMESPEWFQVVDEFGIPSTGARDRFEAITNKELVNAGIPQQTIQLLPFIPTILTKLGPSGVLLTELLGPDDERLTSTTEAPYILSRCSNGGTVVGGVYMRHFPAMPLESEEVKSVNGAGDTFLGVVVAGLALGAKLDERLITLAQVGAVMTLKSELAVSRHLKTLQTSLKNLL